ncbi:sialate O-acetylesterase [Fibrella aquatica]|uniref:sialate O-acetylesterase n=1 Tax=Fibrella aquatica TaxID=3242487 RepID=UPI0035209196
MKYGYTFLLMVGSFMVALGQSSVVFQTLPYDLQLFPRNAANQAALVVEGTVTNASVRRVTVQVDRAGTLSQTYQQTLPASRKFRFEPQIRAELAEYTLRVYVHRQPGDSSLVAERKRLLCGDLFVIYGQSNAFGLEDLEKIAVNDQFMRQCGYAFGATTIPESMRWFPALQPYGAVGAFGLYMGEAIQKATQIPVGFVNGAEGGANIGQLSDRNAGNPADLNTFYGRMLYRVQWAGAQQQVKAILYKQGEAEAGSSVANYPASFDRLYQMLRQDYGNVPRLYVSQINILTSGSPDAGALRDFQRRLTEIYPEGVGNMATVGSPGYDGLHYNLVGNRQIGYEQANQLMRDLYGSGATEQVNSPNVRQVYQNSRNDTVTVVFESAMQMRWPSDSTLTKKGQTYTRRLIDLFMADGQAGRFSRGWAEGNRVYLTLRQPAALQTLSYFPSFYGEEPGGFYDGPTLKNQLGVRAFTFDRYPVARALAPVNNLSVSQTTRESVSLVWTVTTPGVTAILLERSDANNASFRQVARLAAETRNFTDTPTGNGQGPYAYRIRLVGQRAESGVSNVVEGRLLSPCALSATITGNTAVPYGGTLTLSVVVAGTNATNPVTYLWRGPGGLTTAAADLRQQGLTPGLSGIYTVTALQGSCSAIASVSVVIQVPLSVEPIPGNLVVWPNPVRGGQLLYLNVPEATPNEPLTIRLTDAAGKVVAREVQRKQSATLAIFLPQLPSGIYVIELKSASTAAQFSRLLIE